MKIPFASLLVAAVGVGLVPGLPASKARAQLTKTVTVAPTSGPASPCRCQDVTIVVVYGTNGSITFVANDASVSPSTTSYSVSTSVDVGCPPGFDVMPGTDIGAHTTNGGSGNGTTSVPSASAVG
ncbi:MAG TPA: hypothetical protein VEI02_13950, partial [Planctomycetota bacterium]|nr:hypothetical protein [Planctomycetota bacterium]